MIYFSQLILVILLICLVYLFLKPTERFTDDDVSTVARLITKGDTGKQGPTGPQGLPGDPGINGLPGAVGPDGDNATPDLLGITIKDDGKVVTALTLPKQLCLGDGTCIGESDLKMMKERWNKCNVRLWDAPLNYRIYSSIHPHVIGNDAINWYNVRNSSRVWTDSRLASKYGWHPAVPNGGSVLTYDNNWMQIRTDPMLSQKVKGFRCLPRNDLNSNSTQYVTSIYIVYMPLAPGSVEIPCEVGDNAKLGKLYDFNNNAARSGFEIFFAKEVECRYIRIIYNTYVGTPANRCGLYLCV